MIRDDQKQAELARQEAALVLEFAFQFVKAIEERRSESA